MVRSEITPGLAEGTTALIKPLDQRLAVVKKDVPG